MTWLFGGDFQGSLIAFSLLTIFSLASISWIIAYLIFRRRKPAIWITNLVLILVIVQPLLFTNGLTGTSDILSALKTALSPGNSARFVRGMILPVSVGMYFLIDICYQKISERSQNRMLQRWLPYIGTGVIAGTAFLWSNDYGISVWVCMALMTAWVSFVRNRKIRVALRDVVVELVASGISLFCFAMILTRGNFTSWIRETFGTGGYQSWYYNSSKIHYIFDIDCSYLMLMQVVIALIYLILLFWKRGSREAIIRYGVPAFVNLTCYCAVNEYRMLSGGGAKEVALSVLFLTLFCEGIAYLYRRNLFRIVFKKGTLLVGIFCAIWCVGMVKQEIMTYFISDSSGKYVEALGGYLSSLQTDIANASGFLDGDDFWSTYASAQEVVEDSYQPSGIDYIIHVLGDEQRKTYMDTFLQSDVRYTATIRKSYTNWEYWVERANWFFYRELYANWHPVFANAYEMYWERNEKEQEYTLEENYEIEVEWVDATTVKLKLQTDEEVNGVADIWLDYSVEKYESSKLAKLMYQRVLKVENTGNPEVDSYYESNYLRAQSAEYIPMQIVDGYGELTLTTQPQRRVYLDLKDVSCNKIYTVLSKVTPSEETK
jgi:hypothetical protein